MLIFTEDYHGESRLRSFIIDNNNGPREIHSCYIIAKFDSIRAYIILCVDFTDNMIRNTQKTMMLVNNNMREPVESIPLMIIWRSMELPSKEKVTMILASVSMYK